MRNLIKICAGFMLVIKAMYGQENIEVQKAWEKFLEVYKNGPPLEVEKAMNNLINFGELVVPVICPVVQDREVFPFLKIF